MNLSQENLDRAQVSGNYTLHRLSAEHIDLSRTSTRELHGILTDLQAIESAIQIELMNRAP